MRNAAQSAADVYNSDIFASRKRLNPKVESWDGLALSQVLAIHAPFLFLFTLFPGVRLLNMVALIFSWLDAWGFFLEEK